MRLLLLTACSSICTTSAAAVEQQPCGIACRCTHASWFVDYLAEQASAAAMEGCQFWAVVAFWAILPFLSTSAFWLFVQAFVDFENYEEAAKAMREKDHKVFNEKFGDRYVRLIQVRLGARHTVHTFAGRFVADGACLDMRRRCCCCWCTCGSEGL